MEYLVYMEDVNAHRIIKYNVLSDYDIFIKKLKKICTLEEFRQKLMREMQYRFWSRCEYELLISIRDDDHIILSPWIASRHDCHLDVTEDNLLDWKAFAHSQIDKFRYPHRNEAKIDIYDQIKFNEEKFIDYCWNYYIKSSTSGRIVLNRGVKK